VAALGAIAGGTASPAVAARPLRCGSVTIPVTVTKTIPLTYSDTTADGVTCKWVERVFLPDLSRAGSAPPPGWSIRVDAERGVIVDTCTRGKDATIVFHLTRVQ
jgi:hypothetical protein